MWLLIDDSDYIKWKYAFGNTITLTRELPSYDKET